MRSVAAALTISTLFTLGGCSLDRTGVSGGQDPLDATVELDASAIDAAVDAGQELPDAGLDLDSGLDAGMDGGTDAGVDAGSDGGTDAGVDGGTDAGVDGGTDAGVDAGVDSGSPSTCADRYGSLRQYELCVETATTCEFYVDPSSDSSCNTICESVGGTCISARDEGASSNCGSGGARACDSVRRDIVCTCTR